ncbi:MAG: hypothetical protein ACOX0X_03205 [Candidatus Dojkabacteria bacterium]|jgi:hypothetical protein
MSNIDILIKVKSVKNTFRKRLTPGIGKIDKRQREPSKHEMSMAEVVIREFGGKIQFLAGKGDLGLKTPDALWSGIKLEIKSAKGKSSIDSQTRKGLQQIQGEGVIFLDISGSKKSIKEIRQETIHRTRRYLLSNQKGNVNIIIVKNKKIIDVLEIKKMEA